MEVYSGCMDTNYDLASIVKEEHLGKWIALTLDQRRIIDCATTLEELSARVPPHEAIYTKVRATGVSYAF